MIKDSKRETTREFLLVTYRGTRWNGSEEKTWGKAPHCRDCRPEQVPKLCGNTLAKYHYFRKTCGSMLHGSYNE